MLWKNHSERAVQHSLTTHDSRRVEQRAHAFFSLFSMPSLYWFSLAVISSRSSSSYTTPDAFFTYCPEEEDDRWKSDARALVAE